MFNAGDVVKVLIPNVANVGYDYRLTAPAKLGTFVRVNVLSRPYIGVVFGIADSGLAPEKLKIHLRYLMNIFLFLICNGFRKCLNGH